MINYIGYIMLYHYIYVINYKCYIWLVSWMPALSFEIESDCLVQVCLDYIPNPDEARRAFFGMS